MLPCKHFVAVMRDIKDWSWSKFPESYRCSPFLTLDEIVNPKPPEELEATTSKADGVADNPEGIVYYRFMLCKLGRFHACSEIVDLNLSSETSRSSAKSFWCFKMLLWS